MIAMIAGIAFISSVVIVTIIDDVLLANFVVPGDTAALARDIEANEMLFGFAVASYLIVLALDSVVSLAFYVVLRPANKNLALLTTVLRLLYVAILVSGLFALVFQIINVYGYEKIKFLGYIFFALHIFVLGYSIFKSEYIPKALGILLMFASITYMEFFVELHLSEIFKVIIMLIMAISELSLCIWLMVKRTELPQNNIK